jgi:opacity protein-like surface antigen
MKTRKILTAGLLLAGLPLSAQDIYKMETFSGEDLNGTARFVGMGGAMSALGADISTIGTNPAAIGLYRRSDISMTGSLQTQSSAESFANRDKTHASFDQMGFVYAAKLGNDKFRFVNFGFNYHKRRNFKNYFTGRGTLNGLSQSLQLLDLSYVGGGFLDLDNDDDRERTTPLTLAAYDTQLLEKTTDANGNVTGYTPVSGMAQRYYYQRANWGGIQQYDFNLSMNWNDQVYAGMTIGLYNVNYHSYTNYSETLANPADITDQADYYTTNEESISGTGIDVKLGVILRPFEDSPFRVGVAIHTPTFYDLTSSQRLYMNTPFESTDNQGNVIASYSDRAINPGDNDYKIRTPWKFNISMATTVGNILALDAEYEYRDFGSTSVRYPDYGYNDRWNEGISGWHNSFRDPDLDNEASRYLKSMSTLRLGAELRMSSNAYLRVGYNYETSPFKKDAYLNLFTNSSSYYYADNTDYVNLGNIHRLTAGLGLRGTHFYADAAYQYQRQKGDLYTFHVPGDTNDANLLQPVGLDLNRHQALLTVGYKF